MAFEGYANIIADALMRGSAGLGEGIGSGLSGASQSIAAGIMQKKANEREDKQRIEDFQNKMKILDDQNRQQMNMFGLEQAHDLNKLNIDPATARLNRQADLTLGHSVLEATAKNARAAAIQQQQAELDAAKAAEQAILAELSKVGPGGQQPAPSGAIVGGQVVAPTGQYMGPSLSATTELNPQLIDIQNALSGY